MAFDPDAYLAEKSATPKAGGFDPDAYLAERGVKPKVVDPRFVDDGSDETRPFSVGARSYGQETADLAATHIPTTGERVVEGVKNVGRTIAAGAGAAKEGVLHPIDTVKSPERRREVLRGVDKMVSLGYGQKLASRIGSALGDAPEVQLGPETFSGAPAANTQQTDRAAAPGFQEFGAMLGIATPGATSLVAKGGAAVARAVPGVGVLPSVARSVAGYEATAPVLAGLSADSEGRRLEAATEAAGDPTGLALSTGAGLATGAGSKLAAGAAGRTERGAKAGITTGEQNAGIRKVRKFDATTGTDDEFLRDLFKRNPDIEKHAYIKGATKPAVVVKVVERKLARAGQQLDDTYDQMAKADRLVTPRDIDKAFEGMIASAVREGDAPALRVLRGERSAFNREYRNFGKLSPDTMRGLKNSAGELAFGKADVPKEVRARVWRVYADAIETQAKGTPGVDVKKLRELNKDTQILMAAKDALTERAVAQAAKRKSFGQHMLGKGLVVGGLAAGGIPGAVAGYAAPKVLSALGEQARRVDYALGRAPRVADALSGAAGPAGAIIGGGREAR